MHEWSVSPLAAVPHLYDRRGASCLLRGSRALIVVDALVPLYHRNFYMLMPARASLWTVELSEPNVRAQLAHPWVAHSHQRVCLQLPQSVIEAPLVQWLRNVAAGWQRRTPRQTNPRRSCAEAAARSPGTDVRERLAGLAAEGYYEIEKRPARRKAHRAEHLRWKTQGASTNRPQKGPAGQLALRKNETRVQEDGKVEQAVRRQAETPQAECPQRRKESTRMQSGQSQPLSLVNASWTGAPAPCAFAHTACH